MKHDLKESVEMFNGRNLHLSPFPQTVTNKRPKEIEDITDHELHARVAPKTVIDTQGSIIDRNLRDNSLSFVIQMNS